MAGYSATPLAGKLGIRTGHRLLLLGAPEGFAIPDLPAAVTLARRAAGQADVLLSFHTRRAELARRLPVLRDRMRPAAHLWIAWPKKASRRPTDLTEDVVRELALATRLVDTKVCAIDEVWSGLRLTIRVRDR
jgi:hypothetical protein